ncbi:MAG: hypothetical protein J0H31_11280 [Alphaproteobacteria bacterium]|nr:hypothetical protein [Alphaproteobacteria bacterium]
MTREEFENNRRRFGEHVGDWPAPYRQEALEFLGLSGDADPGDAPDRALERLVREAALADGDDAALARKVLARIDADRARPSLLPRFLFAPAGFSACAAAILVAAMLAGYQFARSQDDAQDAELLALASGARLTDGGGPGIAADPGEGDSL